MKRRDFIKLTAVATASLSLPLALTSPTGSSEWKEFYVCTFLDEPAFNSEMLAGAHWAFKRKMLDENFTEIRGFHREINYDATRQVWIHTAVAQLR